MSHQHKCGFGMGGFLGLVHGEPLAGGCDHVWEHADKDKDCTTDDGPHFCPVCGSGPWCLHYHPRTCEVKGIPYTVPEQVGRDNPEFQRACKMAACGSSQSSDGALINEIVDLLREITKPFPGARR